MKKNCQAFTVTQLGEAMAVLKKQSEIKNCQLKVVNGLDCNVNFGIAQNTWKLNASLAVELSKAWLSYQSEYIIKCLLFQSDKLQKILI